MSAVGRSLRASEAGAVSAESEPIFAAAKKPERSVPREEPKQEEIKARALLEIPGDPVATAVNAARLRSDLTPPRNPYPTVADQVRLNKIRQVERRALDQANEGVEKKV